MLSTSFVHSNYEDSRRQERIRQDETQSWDRLQQRFYSVERAGGKIYHLYQQFHRIATQVTADQEDSPELAYPKPHKVVKHFQFLVFLAVAYIISLLLIYSSTEYLVDLLARGNRLLTTLGIVTVPIAIIAMQLSIAVNIHLAEKHNLARLKDRRRNAKMLVLVTPAMILGTFLAETWGGWPWLPDVLLLAVRMILAYITDVGIISNGGSAYEAQCFFLFSFTQLRLKKQQKQLQESLTVLSGELVQQFQELHQELTHFRSTFPESEATLPDFSNNTRWVLEKWIGPNFDQP